MIDRYLMPVMRRVLAKPARDLVSRGIDADRVTLTGFAIGMLAVPVLWIGWPGLALLLILANRLADGLDGAVARLTQPTDRGAFLDVALDFVFYAAVPLGFALYDPGANALAAAVLITAFVGTGSSFLAFAAIAERRGLSADAYPHKGIYYLGGLTEGAETILVFVLMCLYPGAFAFIAYVFALACAVTTVSRWRMGWELFDGEGAADGIDDAEFIDEAP